MWCYARFPNPACWLPCQLHLLIMCLTTNHYYVHHMWSCLSYMFEYGHGSKKFQRFSSRLQQIISLYMVTRSALYYHDINISIHLMRARPLFSVWTVGVVLLTITCFIQDLVLTSFDSICQKPNYHPIMKLLRTSWYCNRETHTLHV